MIRRLLVALALLLAIAVVGLVLIARGAIGGDVVRRQIEQQLTARLKRPVRIVSIGTSVFPRLSVNLHGVTIGEPPVATIDEVSMAMGLRGLISKRIEDADVIVSNGRIPLQLALGLAGTTSGGSSPGAGGFEIVSVRTFALRDTELVAGQRSLRVNLEASLMGDRLHVPRLVAEVERTRLEAQGELSSIARGEGKFGTRAEHLNLDELLAFLSEVSRTAGSGGGGPTGLKLEVGVHAPAGELGGYRFQSLSSVVRISPSQVTLQPLQFRMFDGGFEGHLRVAIAGASPQLLLNGEASGMDIPTILRDTGASSAAITGQLDARVSVSSSGASTAEILRRTRGGSEITISDGVFPASIWCAPSCSHSASRQAHRHRDPDRRSRGLPADSRSTIRRCGPTTSRWRRATSTWPAVR